MARVLVEVDDPLGLERGAGGSAGRGLLLLDSYVDLLLEGGRIRNLFEVPREWIQEGGHLWMYSGDRLERRPVDVAWRFEDSVCIDEGLTDGELVVASRIATPIDGMKLRMAADASPVTAAEFLSIASRWDVSAWGGVPTGAIPAPAGGAVVRPETASAPAAASEEAE